MASPIYLGQAAASRTSWLGSWFGTTPNYTGQGQPVSASSLFGGAAPAYKPAPVADDTAESDDGAACPIPPFAIVVPRRRCGADATSDE